MLYENLDHVQKVTKAQHVVVKNAPLFLSQEVCAIGGS